MNASRFAARLAALAVEAVFCFGILASTWLLIGEVLADQWPHRVIRMYPAGGRELAEQAGIVEEPEHGVILDP
jgi:hypothetical protein